MRDKIFKICSQLQFECAKIRRAKETELELLHAIIQNLDDEDEVEKLGNVILSGPATVGPEMKERYMVKTMSAVRFFAMNTLNSLHFLRFCDNLRHFFRRRLYFWLFPHGCLASASK